MTATLRGVIRPTPSPDRGWFITIEGPEGAGKTTQAARLEAHLVGHGVAVVRTREPGGTRLGEQIREILLRAAGGDEVSIDPLADALLFNAARRQLVDEVIRPARAAGRTVICTRFADSTLAYQGFGAGVPLAVLRSLQDIATGGLRPDLTILLDLPAEVGLARKVPDDRTRFETAFDLAFHERVRAGFRTLAEAEPERFAVIDAEQPEHDVAAEIERVIHRLRGAAAPADEPPHAPERIPR